MRNFFNIFLIKNCLKMHLDLDCITFGIVEQSVEKSHGGAAMYVKLPKKVDLAISNVFGMIQLNIFFSGA